MIYAYIGVMSFCLGAIIMYYPSKRMLNEAQGCLNDAKDLNKQAEFLLKSIKM